MSDQVAPKSLKTYVFLHVFLIFGRSENDRFLDRFFNDFWIDFGEVFGSMLERFWDRL